MFYASFSRCQNQTKAVLHCTTWAFLDFTMKLPTSCCWRCTQFKNNHEESGELAHILEDLSAANALYSNGSSSENKPTCSSKALSVSLSKIIFRFHVSFRWCICHDYNFQNSNRNPSIFSIAFLLNHATQRPWPKMQAASGCWTLAEVHVAKTSPG